jgi:hypothetical protein
MFKAAQLLLKLSIILLLRGVCCEGSAAATGC